MLGEPPLVPSGLEPPVALPPALVPLPPLPTVPETPLAEPPVVLVVPPLLVVPPVAGVLLLSLDEQAAEASNVNRSGKRRRVLFMTGRESSRVVQRGASKTRSLALQSERRAGVHFQ